jgi:hypothetical protein
MCVASISVPCTPIRCQHVGISHLTTVMEFVVNHIMCAQGLVVDTFSDKVGQLASGYNITDPTEVR